MPAVAAPQNVARVRYAGEQEFPEGEFVTLKQVPVFAEHQTKARDGRNLKFGKKELEALAKRCNRRIEETGDYAAITLGHTAEPGDSQAKQPEMVGFAGPFKVGLIGPKGKQRYAVLADFHVHAEDYPKLKKYPRRSPELWLEDRYEEMFLDPIALLGAEAPRLDMGLLYAANRQGRLVEKYAAVASATSSFIPTDKYGCGEKKQAYEADSRKDTTARELKVSDAAARRTGSPDSASPKSEAGGKNQLLRPEFGNTIGKRYEGDDETKSQGGASAPSKTMNLNPDDIRGIVDALEQLDWVQWVKGQMQADSAGNGTLPDQGPDMADAGMGNPDMAQDLPDASDAGGMGAEAPLDDMGGESGLDAPGGDPGLDAAGGAAPLGGPPAIPPPPKDKNMAQQYGADASIQGSGTPAGSGDIDAAGTPRQSGGYDKKPAMGSREAYARMAGQVTKLQGMLTEERTLRIDTERKSALTELAERRDFDLSRELERCRYSKMTAAQFTEHCENIEENYRPTMMNVDLPTFEDAMMASPDRPGRGATKEKYSQQHRDRALKMAKRMGETRNDKGELPDTTGLYERCLEEVASGNGK